jgi:hypothetical protein
VANDDKGTIGDLTPVTWQSGGSEISEDRFVERECSTDSIEYRNLIQVNFCFLHQWMDHRTSFEWSDVPMNGPPQLNRRIGASCNALRGASSSEATGIAVQLVLGEIRRDNVGYIAELTCFSRSSGDADCIAINESGLHSIKTKSHAEDRA